MRQFVENNDSGIEDHVASSGRSGAGNWRRVLTAFAIGAISCLIGPVFLVFYYARHGFDLGLSDTTAFLGIAYVSPGFLFIAAGLWLGHLLANVCPPLSNRARRIVVITAAAVTFSVSVCFLVYGFLNFGINVVVADLPAFSIACGFSTLMTTSLSLATAGSCHRKLRDYKHAQPHECPDPA